MTWGLLHPRLPSQPPGQSEAQGCPEVHSLWPGVLVQRLVLDAQLAKSANVSVFKKREREMADVDRCGARVPTGLLLCLLANGQQVGVPGGLGTAGGR